MLVVPRGIAMVLPAGCCCCTGGDVDEYVFEVVARLCPLLSFFKCLLPLLLAVVERCCPAGPCMLKTCTSTLQMLHSFHRMLGALVSACVLMLWRLLLLLLLLAILSHVPLQSLLSRVPHTM